MSEFLSISLFALGFFLILKGGDLLVESSVWIAEATKLPAMVIGATIVSIATTLPEATVAFLASLSNQEELALNTSVGSIICNFALVLGISFMLLPSKIDSKAVAKRSVFISIVLLIFVLFSLDLSISFAEGIFLFALFFVYILFNIRQSKQGALPLIEEKKERPRMVIIIIQFLISSLAIGYGASVLVNNVRNISLILGISEQLIGISFIAVGTNIPEIVTTLASVKKKSPEIGMGNIFGASFINATLLIGGSTMLAPDREITMQKYIPFLSIPILFVILFVVTYPILKKGKSTRFQGFVLLLLYVIYSIAMAAIL